MEGIDIAAVQITATSTLALEHHKVIAGRFKYFLVAMSLGMSPLCIQPASAGLGGSAASVLSDTQELHGVAHSTVLQDYEVHEISTDSGMFVREFLDRNGVVFAVAWNAPVVPDLRRLLGASFDAYVKALTALTPGLRKSLRIASPELVVESGGHMRAYSGRAYLPALVPAGTSAADLH